VRQRVPRLLTVRAMVMGVVGLLAFVLVYPTLHSYLAERAEVDQLRAQVAAATAANDDLRADLARWDDPAYVAAQARERLSFVMPGETAFRVVDPDSISADGTVVAEPDDDDGLVGSTRPWYLRVWDSVEQAGAADDASGATGPATVPDPATSAVPGPAVTP
jgi:cell division protein FtsB